MKITYSLSKLPICLKKILAFVFKRLVSDADSFSSKWFRSLKIDLVLLFNSISQNPDCLSRTCCSNLLVGHVLCRIRHSARDAAICVASSEFLFIESWERY